MLKSFCIHHELIEANSLSCVNSSVYEKLAIRPVHRQSGVSRSRPGSLFTKRTDVLPHDFVKSWSREIRVLTFPSSLKFNRHFGSSAACQFSERCDHYNIQSRGFQTSRDMAVRLPSAWWIEALKSLLLCRAEYSSIPISRDEPWRKRHFSNCLTMLPNVCGILCWGMKPNQIWTTTYSGQKKTLQICNMYT